MRRPQFGPRILRFTALVVGLPILGGVALIERELWLEADGRRRPSELLFDLEGLSFGFWTTLAAVVILAVTARRWRRRSRPQFSVRRLMVAVAGVALILGPVARTAQWARTAFSHRDAAISHGRLAATLRHNGSALAEMARRAESEGFRRAHLSALAEHTEAADYFEALRAKYSRAARRPWAPVEPDPAPPS